MQVLSTKVVGRGRICLNTVYTVTLLYMDMHVGVDDDKGQKEVGGGLKWCQ